MKDLSQRAVDAQVKHREHPATFEVPSPKELDHILPTQYVKICVDDERFWVQVQAVNGNTCTGVIANDLVFTFRHGLRCDDVVSFEKRHIYNILAD